jgi:hypothetical protein
MDSTLGAALLFWLPLLMVALGAWISSSMNNSTIGRSISFIGLAMVMISPWTIPSSDSTAVGQLLLNLLIPVIIMCWGLYGMVFGGHVPVQRLPPSSRWIGLAICITAITGLALMHWSIMTPMWRGEINPYWIVFWPTFLLFTISISSVACVSLLTLGTNRLDSALRLATLGLLTAGLTISAMLIDGAITSAEAFREHLWMASADILGIILGAGSAIIVFTIVIWTYENTQQHPSNTTPPSAEEYEHVAAVIADNIGGGEDE